MTSRQLNYPQNQKKATTSSSECHQPRLPTSCHVLQLLCIIICLAFLPITSGGCTKVKDKIIDYTNCTKSDDQNTKCADFIEKYPLKICNCTIRFNLTESFVAAGENCTVDFYYSVTNFETFAKNLQNYNNSKDDNQLLGNLSSTPSYQCEPFVYAEDGRTMKPIALCGALANYMFNDTISISIIEWVGNIPVPILRTGIVEPEEKAKYNPPGNLSDASANFSTNWYVPFTKLDLDNEDNNGIQNEGLITWMRPENSSSSFRKLYGRLDTHNTNFIMGLRSNEYELNIQYNYPVVHFNGTKQIIISLYVPPSEATTETKTTQETTTQATTTLATNTLATTAHATTLQDVLKSLAPTIASFFGTHYLVLCLFFSISYVRANHE